MWMTKLKKKNAHNQHVISSSNTVRADRCSVRHVFVMHLHIIYNRLYMKNISWPVSNQCQIWLLRFLTIPSTTHSTAPYTLPCQCIVTRLSQPWSYGAFFVQARQQTAWWHCGTVRNVAHSPWASPTPWAAPSPARPTAASTSMPGLKSAWPARRCVLILVHIHTHFKYPL